MKMKKFYWIIKYGFSFFNKKQVTTIFFLFFVFYSHTSQADTAGMTEDTKIAFVSSVVDGDTVILETEISGLREVRLVGTQAPKLPLNRKNFRKWPLADEAKEQLERLSIGQRFRLEFTGRGSDRHGRLLAHMFRDDGLWLQGKMVENGLARVYTFSDNRALAHELLKRERAARTAMLGIWKHPYYAIRSPDSLSYDIDSFQLVEGEIVKASRVGNWVYLNFGPNWRTDFTVSIRARDIDQFDAAGIDLLRLSGSTVLVRGWVTNRNGPLITLNHPEPLEIIAP